MGTVRFTSPFKFAEDDDVSSLMEGQYKKTHIELFYNESHYDSVVSITEGTLHKELPKVEIVVLHLLT